MTLINVFLTMLLRIADQSLTRYNISGAIICHQGRVALERIQIFPIFGDEKNWQKFLKFQILAVVALDQHVGTKTFLIEIYVIRSILLN